MGEGFRFVIGERDDEMNDGSNDDARSHAGPGASGRKASGGAQTAGHDSRLDDRLV